MWMSQVDDVTGIVQIMLPNGARVNYACTPNESQGVKKKDDAYFWGMCYRDVFVRNNLQSDFFVVSLW